MSSIQVKVPLVFWGREAPTHEILCICQAEAGKAVATGSSIGQICIWDMYRRQSTREPVLKPRLMLFGSSESPVRSLAFVRNWSGDRDRIVSINEQGSISLWDCKDGTCLRSNSSLSGKHTGIKCMAEERYHETLIAVYGHYSHIFILDPNTLEQVCVLKSSHNPNWMARICFIPYMDKNTALAAVTVDGTSKLWLLHPTSEMKEMGSLYEEKSKALGISCPLSLASCSIHSCCVVLVVCQDSWQLYDGSSGRMKQLLICPCETNVKSWVGGEFVSYHLLLAWADDGTAFLYQIAPNILPGLEEAVSSDDESIPTSGLVLLAMLKPPDTAASYRHFSMHLASRWNVIGDSAGRLYAWSIEGVLLEVASEEKKEAQCIPCDISRSLAESWEAPSMPCSITECLYSDRLPHPEISCSLYLSKFGRLICGQSDGSIVVLSATQAATRLLLEERKISKAWPQHYFLRGHTGRVTCLTYPREYSKAYDENYLLSGSADFSVKLWNLYKGQVVHTFAVHGGEVKRILACPPDINPRLQSCVCSIADDNSVALLSTSERKSLLLASRHSAPVESIYWRLEEDFILVKCEDGRLYVWQIETGILDRCVDGEKAHLILESSCTSASLKPIHATVVSSPLQVKSLRIGEQQSHVQVLIFDPQILIVSLSRMEKTRTTSKRVLPPTKHARAFRTYISARKQFSSSDGGEYIPERPSGSPLIAREQQKAREAIGHAVSGGQKEEVIQPEPPTMIINIARLLVSCLHAWNLDPDLDEACKTILGIIRPARPISFGLLSTNGCLSLVVPGWGVSTKKSCTDRLEQAIEETKKLMAWDPQIKTAVFSDDLMQQGRPRSLAMSSPAKHGYDDCYDDQDTEVSRIDPEEKPELAYHIRWQLSRSLTTQHLLTVVSITNTLMNHSVGAHALSSSSGLSRKQNDSADEDSDDDSGDDNGTSRDNHIRAVWSRVAALHCVMLPERMAGYFRAPHLPVLAARFMDPCQAIREAAQALLQAELRRLGHEGRLRLVSSWSGKLQVPPGRSSLSESRSKFLDEWDSGDAFSHATPTQQQQTTALIIMGMIGAEFTSSAKGATPSLKTKVKKKGSTSPDGVSAQDTEVMEPSVARQTAKTLQGVLLQRPAHRANLYSSLRCSAAELMGRGFHLWENYVDVALVVMGLLDLALNPAALPPAGDDSRLHRKGKAAKFMADIARRSLNLMVLVRPITIVNTLAKEVSLFLGSQHVASYPHSSLPPVQVGVTLPPNTGGILTPASQLLPNASSTEILELMKTILDKCSTQITLQLLEIVDILLFCVGPKQLRRANLSELFPSLIRLPNVSYCHKTHRLAVGARSGQVAIYDLKQGKTQMINAYSHSVSVLTFSDDGKLLATYSYGDSKLQVWQLGMSLLGGVINQTPKCIESWPAVSSSVLTGGSFGTMLSLEWTTSKGITLHLGKGMDYNFSLRR